ESQPRKADVHVGQAFQPDPANMTSSMQTSQRIRLLQGLLALVLGLICPSSWADELKAGAARVEITPPVGHQLWGLASRVGPSTAVLDSLYGRILVLRTAPSSIALVALDLGRTFDTQHLADLRLRVKSEFGIQHVVFSASHTHNGPTPLDKKYILPGSNRWE